jgi:hypothetical protein
MMPDHNTELSGRTTLPIHTLLAKGVESFYGPREHPLATPSPSSWHRPVIRAIARED